MLATTLALVALHYSYSGDDPARWTRAPLAPRQAAAPADFTAFPCNAAACTVSRLITDADGNTYIVGSRRFQVGTSQASDVYVAKLDPAGATVFLATFGGKGNDQGRALALDPAGNICIGGSTTSPNFPLRNPFRPEPAAGFLLKLSPDGSQLHYSTYFDGTVNAIAADAAGNLYATGQTGSRDFPATPGMPAGPVNGMGPGGTVGAFVAKLSAAGDRILYAGRISGSTLACTGGSSCFLSLRSTTGDAIALDAAGNAYVAGNANVTDLPATEGAMVRSGLGPWVARINASGARLDYLTYLGAARFGSGTFVSAASWASGLTVDGAGNAYIAGRTSDPRFPVTPGALQTVYGGPADPPLIGPVPPSDAFIAKLNPQGTGLVYATYLGGAEAEAATAIALDSAGAAYITGTTGASDFLAVLNPAGSALNASAQYPGASVSQAVAVDADGRVRAAGPSGIVSSLDLNAPPSPRLFGIMNAAGGLPGPAVSPGEIVSLFGAWLGPENGMAAQPDPAGRMPTELSGTQVLFDGVAAPLLYVSQTQINAVAPFGLTPGKTTVVRIRSGAAVAPEFGAVVVHSRPAIFGNGGYAAAVNQDGTINSQSNPARLGSVVSIWVTGVGPVFPVPTDGQVAAAAQDYHCCEVLVADKSVAPLYAGAAPGMVAGAFQINFQVPADLPAGSSQEVPIRLRVFPSSSPPLPDTSSAWIFVGP